MKTKICSNPKCLKEKLLSEFSKRSASKDGLSSQCKDCKKEYNTNYNDNNKEKISNQRKEYYEKFPWKKILVSIKQRCNNPKNKDYKYYGERGIENHLTIEDIKFLYIHDKAYLMENPSIDRKNNDKNYTLANCRFIEQGKNTAERNVRVLSKSTLQYSKGGKFIKEWKSIREIERILKINHSNIIQCCKGNVGYSHAGGFKWKYKKD